MSEDILANFENPLLTQQDRTLIREISIFTKEYFQNPKFDSSHDFNHVMRVVHNALHILDEESRIRVTRGCSALNPRLVILGALLHDVGDKKYTDANAQQQPLAKLELLDRGMAEVEAEIVQSVVDGVSYSSEIKNPNQVRLLIQQIPELAIVQDADRLDAIGAVGIGRCFTFGGARRARTLDDSIEHFNEKLLKLESMMKTETGKQMAAGRSKKIHQFLEWWKEETTVVYDGKMEERVG